MKLVGLNFSKETVSTVRTSTFSTARSEVVGMIAFFQTMFAVHGGILLGRVETVSVWHLEIFGPVPYVTSYSSPASSITTRRCCELSPAFIFCFLRFELLLWSTWLLKLLVWSAVNATLCSLSLLRVHGGPVNIISVSRLTHAVDIHSLSGVCFDEYITGRIVLCTLRICITRTFSWDL